MTAPEKTVTNADRLAAMAANPRVAERLHRDAQMIGSATLEQQTAERLAVVLEEFRLAGVQIDES